MQIKEAYPKIADFLSDMNIDILRPFELNSIDDENDNSTAKICQLMSTLINRIEKI